MQCYKYDTLQDVDNAVEALNTYHGLPVNGGETQFSRSSFTLHADGYYYIGYDNEWTAILGTPTTIELEQE